MRSHRLRLRVYRVGPDSRRTGSGPQQEFLVGRPVPPPGLHEPWPPCRCQQATGRPCPLSGDGGGPGENREPPYDGSEGTSQVYYEMRCMSCHELHASRGDRGLTGSWATSHASRTGHLRFRTLITTAGRPDRTTPS